MTEKEIENHQDPITVHIKLANSEEIVCQVPCIEYLTEGTGFVMLTDSVCNVLYTVNSKTGARNLSLNTPAEDHPKGEPIPVYLDFIAVQRNQISSVRVLSALGVLHRYYRQKTSGLVCGAC